MSLPLRSGGETGYLRKILCPAVWRASGSGFSYRRNVDCHCWYGTVETRESLQFVECSHRPILVDLIQGEKAKCQ